MAKARDFKFCTLVCHVILYHLYYKLSLEWEWSQSCDIFKFWKIHDKIMEMVQDKRHSYSGRQIGKHIWPIERHDCHCESGGAYVC